MSNIVSSTSSSIKANPGNLNINDSLVIGSYWVGGYVDTEIMYIEKITHTVVYVPIQYNSYLSLLLVKYYPTYRSQCLSWLCWIAVYIGYVDITPTPVSMSRPVLLLVAHTALCDKGDLVLPPDAECRRKYPNVCRNGRCVDTANSYRCNCFPGFILNSEGECVGKHQLVCRTGLCFGAMRFVNRYRFRNAALDKGGPSIELQSLWGTRVQPESLLMTHPGKRWVKKTQLAKLCTTFGSYSITGIWNYLVTWNYFLWLSCCKKALR